MRKRIGSEIQNVTNPAYLQGYVLNKFKEPKKFVDTVKEIGNSKRKITFKIDLYKLLKDFTALRKSTKSMYYFKNYVRQVKLICRASEREFKHLFE